MSGNVDPDKFIQWVEIAMETHVQGTLGTDLYNKIQQDLTNNVLTTNYNDLLERFVKPITIHYALSEYLPFAAYTIGNGGVYKHQSENSETVSKNEVDYLVQKHLDIAQHYKQRFIDFMCYNQSLYPEWNSNSNDDMYPDHKSYDTGWVI